MAAQHGGYRRMLSFCLCLFLLVCIFNANAAFAQQNAKCSKSSPCHVGCCSKEGVCGFTKDHCGDGCQSNCNAKAECGQYALKENFDCPINVCCSQYGFCGTTEEFCGDGCQKNSDGGGCGSVRYVILFKKSLLRHWQQSNQSLLAPQRPVMSTPMHCLTSDESATTSCSRKKELVEPKNRKSCQSKLSLISTLPSSTLTRTLS